LPPGEAAEHLLRAHERVLGKPVSVQGLSILWSQWAMETGRGKSMYGYNFGGIKATGSEPSASLRTWEGHGTERVRIRSRFRTYANPEQGAEDYISTLAERYPQALEAAHRGDASGFVRALKKSQYFTGDPMVYERAIGSLSREMLTQGPAGVLYIDDPGPHLTALIWAFGRAIARR